MSKKFFLLAMLAGSSICGVTPALAQAGEQSGTMTGADAPRVLTPEEATAKAEFLEAQVASMQEQFDALKKQMSAVKPSWKGAPQFEDKESGWSFKPRGRIQ